MKKHPVKCSHGNDRICKECSRIKMVVLLKNGFDQYKVRSPGGKLINPVFYSFYSKNRRPDKNIIEGMERRLRNEKPFLFNQASRVIQFYDNFTGGLIAEMK